MGGFRIALHGAPGAAVVVLLLTSARGAAVATAQCKAITHFNVFSLGDFKQTFAAAANAFGVVARG